MEHENLACYRGLLSLAEEAANGMTKWPRGHGHLVDQMRRAMASSLLTLAEGNAKRSSRLERRRFFEMSLGSIAEVAACVDLAYAFRLMKRTDQKSFKSRLRLAYVQIRALP